MKVKAIRTFRDKYTQEVILMGSEIEVNDERCAEINSTSFGVLVEVIKDEAKTDEKIVSDGESKDESLDTEEETVSKEKTARKSTKK